MAIPSLTARQRVEFRVAKALSVLPPRAQVRLSGKPLVELDGQTLEPEIQLTLSVLERQGNVPFETLPPPQARVVLRKQAEVATGPWVAVGAGRDLEVDGAAGRLAARHYVPDEPGPHPLLVFYHGGGFVLGDIETHDAACRLLCKHGGMQVLSVDYRLAPEHPWPAGIEDAQASFRWAVEHAASLGADPARVAVGGDSAGGNFAAVVSLLAAREGGPAPAFQLLIYPSVDGTPKVYRSQELFGEGFFLTQVQMDWFSAHYLQGADATDPRISPLLADDLSGVAPALVVSAGFDPLRDEGEAYAAALREAGNVVALRRFPGLIHGFINSTNISRVSRDAWVEVAGASRAMLAVSAVGAELRR